jgi:hypothetical protein
MLEYIGVDIKIPPFSGNGFVSVHEIGFCVGTCLCLSLPRAQPIVEHFTASKVSLITVDSGIVCPSGYKFPQACFDMYPSVPVCDEPDNAS